MKNKIKIKIKIIKKKNQHLIQDYFKMKITIKIIQLILYLEKALKKKVKIIIMKINK